MGLSAYVETSGMSTCVKDHSGDLPADFNRLPESQAARWRHRCAGCAYDLGRRHCEEAENRLRTRVRELTAMMKNVDNNRSGE